MGKEELAALSGLLSDGAQIMSLSVSIPFPSSLQPRALSCHKKYGILNAKVKGGELHVKGTVSIQYNDNERTRIEVYFKDIFMSLGAKPEDIDFFYIDENAGHW